MHCPNRICPAFTTPLHRWVMLRQSCNQLFVGGLSYDTNESILKQAFEEYGEVIEAKVICDRVSGKSRGYGFVHYTEETAASKALKDMDGKLLDGRNIRIHYGHRKETIVDQSAGEMEKYQICGRSCPSNPTYSKRVVGNIKFSSVP